MDTGLAKGFMDRPSVYLDTGGSATTRGYPPKRDLAMTKTAAH